MRTFYKLVPTLSCRGLSIQSLYAAVPRSARLTSIRSARLPSILSVAAYSSLIVCSLREMPGKGLASSASFSVFG